MPQSWPGVGVGEPWYDIVGSMLEDLQLGAVAVLEGDGQRVAVPVDCVREPHGRVVGVRNFAGDGAGGAVSGEYGFEDLDGGGRPQRLGREGGVWVTVPDGGDVAVVRLPPSGHGDVEKLAGLRAAEDGVGGVDRRALGGMDGGGVAEFRVVGDVGSR